MNRFARALLDWFDRHGRHDLPWQQTDRQGRRDAYRVWLSEVMLQQTQVATVIPYFHRFVTALPRLRDLAAADEDRVFALWSGLGYYRRARFLHQAAIRCMTEHAGQLPNDFDQLLALPGIGRSTAGAILAQAHGKRFAILDGNVKRVLTRYHGIDGYPGDSKVEAELWQRADQHTPAERVADYTQAIMDLGATICVRSKPNCHACPLQHTCVAWREQRTAQLPASKPAKTLPTRHTMLLILRDADSRILLERRGPQGVWSGLWSLPEASDSDHAWRTAQAHASLHDAQTLSPFLHVFSHYRLAAEPLLFDHVTAHAAIADNPSWRWFEASQWAALGLPSPIRRLLEQLDDVSAQTNLALQPPRPRRGRKTGLQESP